jgi:DNA polymerase-3 subunit delta
MPKPVHALVGTDLFLQLEKLREILATLPPDVQRINADGETAQLADVLDELRSFSMFSSSKIVVIRDADEFISNFRESMEHYVAKPAPDSLLVLRLKSLPATQRIHKLIATHGQIHHCQPPRDLAGWIVQQARSAHKLTMKPDAARVLLDLIGDDLGRLDNELAKLALQTEGAVDAGSIARTVSFQREQELRELTDAIGIGNVTEAMRRWRHLVQMDSSAEFRAVTWMTMWLEDVRVYLTQPQAFKNAWRYKERLPKFQETARKIGVAGVGRLINLLAEIDLRSKSGLGDMAENVERFLLSVR